MQYRVRESVFRTLSVHDFSNPPNPEFLLAGPFDLLRISFAALLSIFDLSLSSLPLLQRASLVIVRGRMSGIPAAALLQKQRRSPGLGVTSSLRKPPPDLAHRCRDIPNGKKASRSRDRISEIPTAAPFAVGLARADGGAERASAALLLRHDESKRMPPRLVVLLPRFSTISPSLGPSGFVMRRQPLPPRGPLRISLSSASPQLKSLGGTACCEASNPRSAALDSIPSIVAPAIIPLDRTALICRYEHEPGFSSQLSLPPHHRDPHSRAVPLGRLRRWRPALGMPLLRYDLANPRNAARRHAAGFCLAPPRITWQPWSVVG
jgi:hypothetical protein